MANSHKKYLCIQYTSKNTSIKTALSLTKPNYVGKQTFCLAGMFMNILHTETDRRQP